MTTCELIIYKFMVWTRPDEPYQKLIILNSYKFVKNISREIGQRIRQDEKYLLV